MTLVGGLFCILLTEIEYPISLLDEEKRVWNVISNAY